jgi:hypothetical protein
MQAGDIAPSEGEVMGREGDKRDVEPMWEETINKRVET